MMNSHESMERVTEGLNRAASCCRELGAMTNVADWKALSDQFILMRKKAIELYKGGELPEFQVQKLADDIEIAQKMASFAVNGR